MLFSEISAFIGVLAERICSKANEAAVALGNESSPGDCKTVRRRRSVKDPRKEFPALVE